MHSLLEIVINEPFQAELIAPLYSNRSDLFLAFPKAKYPFSQGQWHEVITRDPENTSLMLKRAGEIIGHAALLINGERLYLCFIIIKKEYRGNNLAKELIAQCEEFCRLNYNHRELWLNVDEKNINAIGLYLRQDYVIENQNGDTITMKKKLKT